MRVCADEDDVAGGHGAVDVDLGVVAVAAVVVVAAAAGGVGVVARAVVGGGGQAAAVAQKDHAGLLQKIKRSMKKEDFYACKIFLRKNGGRGLGNCKHSFKNLCLLCLRLC